LIFSKARFPPSPNLFFRRPTPGSPPQKGSPLGVPPPFPHNPLGEKKKKKAQKATQKEKALGGEKKKMPYPRSPLGGKYFFFFDESLDFSPTETTPRPKNIAPDPASVYIYIYICPWGGGRLNPFFWRPRYFSLGPIIPSGSYRNPEFLFFFSWKNRKTVMI